MRFKIYILTILVGILSFLSFYLVFIVPAPFLSGQISDAGGLSLQELKQRDNFGAEEAVFILPISEPTYFPIRDTGVVAPELTAKSFLIYDTKNEKVIFSKDSGRSLPVASLTKLLTAIISLETLNSTDLIAISSGSFNVDGEGPDFHLHEELNFNNLLGAMLVKSSNDAALAIAKTVEQKTGESFAVTMNKKARQIGMTQTHFLDPAGLNDEGYATVRDLLRLVRYSKNYPEVWEFIGSKFLDVVSVDGKFSHHFESTNKLWGNLPNLVGGKTGYTDGALGCMIIEENLPEQSSSVIVILLGSTDRFGEVKKLTDWTRAAFRWK